MPPAIDMDIAGTTGGDNLLVHLQDSDSAVLPHDNDDSAVFSAPHRQLPLAGSKDMVSVNESIISLLIKLHSKLSAKPDSYTLKPDRAKIATLSHTVTKEYQESRIGDACFFVEKVLDKIFELDSACEHAIKVTLAHMWPNQHANDAQEDIEQEKDEAEAKRKRARERQAKIMKEFTERQQKFMAQARETEDTGDMDQETVDTKTVSKECFCVHCHLSMPSTPERPMGHVVLLQATSVLAHKHQQDKDLHLPLTEEEYARQQSIAASHQDESCLGGAAAIRDDLLSHHFDQRSYMLSVNIGWRGGVFVQSCGHQVHLSCLQSYMHSLRGMNHAQLNQNIAVERGEYMCPMCRQLANGVLPIPPDKEASQTVRAKSEYPVNIGHEITSILSEPVADPLSAQHSQLMNAMDRIMDSLTHTTYHRYQHQAGPEHHAIIMFVCSVARTNLELNLVIRGGNLLTATTNIAASPVAPTSSHPKSCILPLLHVLGVHAKRRLPRPLVADWCQVTGLWRGDDMIDARSLMVRDTDVPMLLRDPTTLLIQFVLILPIQIDPVYFTCLVRQLYNLCWMQSCMKVSCLLPTVIRQSFLEDWQTKVRNNTDPQSYLKVDTVSMAIGLLASILEPSNLYFEDIAASLGATAVLPGDSKAQKFDPNVTIEEIEHRIQIECLNFMRIASLLRHYIYNEPIPDIWEPDWEFTRLAQFLGMADSDISGRVWSGPCLGWLTAPANLCFTWTQQVFAFAAKSLPATKKLVLMNSLWKPPQLLRLPNNYDSIFQFYYKRECLNCKTVPKDPSICLICGTMVCLKEQCCRSTSDGGDRGEHEAVRHSIECNAGTAPFLAVNSATIVMLRGRRACIWGSIYLDSFGEEDRELKRGKPLFLSLQRYHFLESQWLTHRFDHTNRRWMWHRESL